MPTVKRTVLIAIAGLLGIIAFGTVGFVLTEGWGLVDALYMAVVSINPIGTANVIPLSPVGKLFYVFLIVAGVAVLALVARSLSWAWVEARLGKLLGRRRMDKAMAQIKGHYITCGYGRMGRLICRELISNHVPFVVVENDDKVVEQLLEEELLHVKGDATEEEVLIKAGVERARGLVTLVSSDAVNLFITMTARQLNPQLYILARAEDEASEKKFLRAGASRVVSPYLIGAQRLAHSILKPAVVDFIELTTQDRSVELWLEELPVPADSSLVGKSLRDSGIRQNLGLMVVAIKKKSGQMIVNPGGEVLIEVGDQLITLGERAPLEKLEGMVQYREGLS